MTECVYNAAVFWHQNTILFRFRIKHQWKFSHMLANKILVILENCKHNVDNGLKLCFICAISVQAFDQKAFESFVRQHRSCESSFLIDIKWDTQRFLKIGTFNTHRFKLRHPIKSLNNSDAAGLRVEDYLVIATVRTCYLFSESITL